MKRHSALSQLIFALCVALTCGRPAFCGEFDDAAKANDLQKVKVSSQGRGR